MGSDHLSFFEGELLGADEEMNGFHRFGGIG
jgi:hypothetical protein